MANFIKAVMEGSGRHVHMSKTDAETLFGTGYTLTPKVMLGEAGEFLSTAKVQIVGPNGRSVSASVLGPFRRETQVELSYTEARTIGLRPPLADSGHLEGTIGVTLSSGEHTVTLPRGAMVARRHVHMPPADAESLGVKNGDMVVLKIDGERGLVFEQVLVRVAPAEIGATYSNVHLDYDEWNAAGLSGAQAAGRIYRCVKDLLD